VKQARSKGVRGAWEDLRLERLEIGEVVSLPVLSGSMLPDLPVGSEIRVRRAPWTQCSWGDIIVFDDASRLVAHRLLVRLRGRGKGLIFQKGDSNPLGRWIDADRVVGVVVGVKDAEGRCSVLSSDAARRRSRGRALRQLARDLVTRIRMLARKTKSWLRRMPKNA
jgi:hypothetical protein